MINLDGLCIERLRERYLNIEKEIEEKTQKAFINIQKVLGKKRNRTQKALQAICGHSLIIEVRLLKNGNISGEPNIFSNVGNRYHRSSPYFRACCICGANEASVFKGEFKILTADPFYCYYESSEGERNFRRFMLMPFGKLRQEAEKLRKQLEKEKQGGL